MGKDVRTKAVKEMFEAILTLQTEEECFAFFEDVCTVNELLTLSQRFEVAKRQVHLLRLYHELTDRLIMVMAERVTR